MFNAETAVFFATPKESQGQAAANAALERYMHRRRTITARLDGFKGHQER